MKVANIPAQAAVVGRRLDASYFLSPGVAAGQRVAQLERSGVPTVTVAGDNGVGTVAPTSRTKRLYAGSGEVGVPYLRPYDVFDYLPQSADILADDDVSQSLRPTSGTIMQTCSGRNLGPLAYADEYIAQFAVSDDMLRLTIGDEQMRMYVLACLLSPTGQALLRRSKTGAVIDHLSAGALASVRLPLLQDGAFERISTTMGSAVAKRERGRLELQTLVSDYSSRYPLAARVALLRDGFTLTRDAIDSRLDVAFYDPSVENARRDLLATGGAPFGEVGRAFMPPRYVRVYVDAGHGRPVISGRQLGQATPVNLRYLAEHSIEISLFELSEGWIVFGGEGRADERLGIPSMVTAERSGWLASEHVMRLVPTDPATAGWLFLAFSIPAVQGQVKAIPCGSVIDELQPRDLIEVILPPVDIELGRQALAAWRLLDEANSLELGAKDDFESCITAALGDAV